MSVTMGDVARKLGISNATVSLALNNSSKVSEATRKKVQAAAEEMGYQTNPYISTLMAARRHGKNPTQMPVMALVAATRREDDRVKLYHLKQFIEGCTVTAQSLGVRPDFFWIGDGTSTARRLNDILCSRGILGAALMTQGDWGEKLDYNWHDVATVSYGARQLEHDTDRISADFYGNMEKTLKILRGQNLSRIGFTMDIPFPYKQDNRWLAAYVMEQERRQLKPAQRIKPWLDPEPSFESFRKWFKASEPEAIICVRPPLVIDWLQRLEVKVPEDIGVVAIGAAEAGGEISGIVENTWACGKLAIEMLLERIHHGEFGNYTDPHHVTISGQWNRGKTLRYLS